MTGDMVFSTPQIPTPWTKGVYIVKIGILQGMTVLEDSLTSTQVSFLLMIPNEAQELTDLAIPTLTRTH